MTDPHSPAPAPDQPGVPNSVPEAAPQQAQQAPQAAPPGQPYGQQPYGQQPYGQYGPPQPSKVLAIISLVTGALALLFSWLPVLAWLLAAAAIVCGVIALVRKMGGKGLSITGIVLGAVAAVIGVVVLIIAMAVVSSIEKTTGKSLDELKSSVASASAAANAEHTVQYKVTTGGPAKVSYVDANGSSNEEITAAWTKEFTDPGYVFGSVSVTADGTDKAAQVTCEIIIDGKSVSKKSATGAYAAAYCSGNLS